VSSWLDLCHMGDRAQTMLSEVCMSPLLNQPLRLLLLLSCMSPTLATAQTEPSPDPSPAPAPAPAAAPTAPAETPPAPAQANEPAMQSAEASPAAAQRCGGEVRWGTFFGGMPYAPTRFEQAQGATVKCRNYARGAEYLHLTAPPRVWGPLDHWYSSSYISKQ